MPIVPPNIDGTLTELSSAVAARDLKPGGLFRVLVNGSVIQTFNITTNIQVFGLGSTPFRRSDLVTVTQQVGSETSPPSAAVTVGGVRTALPSPNLDPRFYVCGAAVLVTALVPGCDVEVEGRVGGGAWALRGRTTAAAQSSQLVILATPLVANEELRVRQLAPAAGLTSNWNVSRARPVVLPTPLPAPIFTAPPRACTNMVSLTQTFVGVRVYYSRAGVASGSAVPNAGSVNLFFSGLSLAQGEAFGALNSLDGCQIQSAERTQRAVAATPNPPVIIGTLCAGASVVHIGGLVPGAEVQIQQDGVVIGTGYPSAEEAFFFVTPLGAGKSIRARQGLCPSVQWSDLSNLVVTGTTSTALPVPTLDPVYDCSLTARVRNVEPGTRVEILSNINGTMGVVTVANNATQADPVDVPLYRKAASGETLTARVTGCSQAARTSAGVLVVVASVRQMNFAPAPEASTTFASLEGAIPGATVEVFLNGVAVASAVAASDVLTVDLPEYLGLLRVDDRLVAYQYFCDSSTASPDTTANAVPFKAWRVTNTSLDILAVHSTIFPSGRVLLFGGSEHNHEPKATRNVNASRLYDPGSNTFTNVGSPNFDLFCCGHAMMADGRMIAAGGTVDYPVDCPPDPDPGSGWHGASGAAIFDDATASWTTVASMTRFRWYPSLTMLADGRVLVSGGQTGTPVGGSPGAYDGSQWEIFNGSTWSNLPGTQNGQYYARLLVVPGGVLDNLNSTAGTLRPAIVNVATGARTDLAIYPVQATQLDPKFNGFNYGVVLLPITRTTTTPEAIFVGGTLEFARTLRMAVGQVWGVIGLNNNNRSDSTTVYAADGTLILIGGGANRLGDSATPGADPLEAELFAPIPRTFSVAEPMAKRRKYHSGGVLLRDGRVLVYGGQKAPPLGNYLGNGSGGCAQWRKNPALPTCDANIYEIEDFRPNYFRVGARPTISFAPSVVVRGTAIDVGTPQAWDVREGYLIRLASFTHGGSTDLRCLQLDIGSRGPGIVRFNGTPTSPELAVAGFYFLFLVRNSGAVSAGWPIRIPL